MSHTKMNIKITSNTFINIKSSLFFKNSLQYHISYFLLVCIAFTLPLHTQLNSILIISFCLSLFFQKKLKKRFANLLDNQFFYLFISLYLIQLIGLIYTTNFHDALYKLETKLSLLILPIALGVLPKLNNKQIHIIVASFALSCLLTTFYYFIITTQAFWLGQAPSFPESAVFLKNISPIGTVYVGMYNIFAIFSILYILLKDWKPTPIFLKVFSIVGILVLYAFVILIGARTALYISFLFVVIYLAYNFYTRQNYHLSTILLAIVSLTITGYFAYKNDINNKVTSVFDAKPEYNTLDLRMVQWGCAAKILLDSNHSLFFGVGTGDVQKHIGDCYVNQNYGSLKDSFNAHNEYIEEALRHGLIGLFVFLSALLIPFYLSIYERRSYLYFLFLLIFIIWSFTESTLSTQKGTVFYAFFNSLLFFHFVNKHKTK